MKTRNELIEYFTESLESHSNYRIAEEKITDLLPFEEFDNYDTTTTDLMTILACNAFILGYEQCKKDILKHINGTTKKR